MILSLERTESNGPLSSSSVYPVSASSKTFWSTRRVYILYIESDSSNGNNGDPFSIQATDQATDYFIYGFGILSNVIAICAVYLSSRFCSEVYRTWLVDMLQARDAMRLEHLSLLHNSLNANDPVVAIFAAATKRDFSMYQCFPWSSCPSGVPDSMPFTLVQKLPKLYGSYSFSSSLFYLLGSKIPDYPSTTPMGNQTAYVLKGKLTFRKSTVEGRRNYTTGQWRLVQSNYPDSSSQQQKG